MHSKACSQESPGEPRRAREALLHAYLREFLFYDRRSYRYLREILSRGRRSYAFLRRRNCFWPLLWAYLRAAAAVYMHIYDMSKNATCILYAYLRCFCEKLAPSALCMHFYDVLFDSRFFDVSSIRCMKVRSPPRRGTHLHGVLRRKLHVGRHFTSITGHF